MNQEEFGAGSKTMMVLVAFGIDMLQVGILSIPFLGIVAGFILAPVITLVATFVFFMWFRSNGVHVYSGKRSLAALGMLVLEILPGMNLFPAWTFWVISQIFTARRASE